MTLCPGLLEDRGQGRAVDRGDHEDLAALRNHVLKLLNLGVHVVVRVLELDLVALGLKLGLHVRPILVPALQGLGGHRHADHLALRPRTAKYDGKQHQSDYKRLSHPLPPSRKDLGRPLGDHK